MQSSIPKYFSSLQGYRYSYNGMEKDNEVSGNGNSYTTQFRQYDPRLGRWKSLDPLMSMFPSISPYVAFDNNPIYYIDPYGLAPSNKGNGGNKDKGEKRKRKKDKENKTDEPVVYTDVEEVDYTYEPGVLIGTNSKTGKREQVPNGFERNEENNQYEYPDQNNTSAQKNRRFGLHGALYAVVDENFQATKKGGSPSGATVFSIDIGDYDHNIFGNQRENYRSSMMDANQRQKDRYALRAMRSNERLIKDLIDDDINLGLTRQRDTRGKLKTFGYHFQLTDEQFIELTQHEDYKDPNSYKPVFRIEIWVWHGDAFDRYRPFYDKYRRARRANAVRLKYQNRRNAVGYNSDAAN